MKLYNVIESHYGQSIVVAGPLPESAANTARWQYHARWRDTSGEPRPRYWLEQTNPTNPDNQVTL